MDSSRSLKTALICPLSAWCLPTPTSSPPHLLAGADVSGPTGSRHCDHIKVVLSNPANGVCILSSVLRGGWVCWGGWKSHTAWTLTDHPPNPDLQHTPLKELMMMKNTLFFSWNQEQASYNSIMWRLVHKSPHAVSLTHTHTHTKNTHTHTHRETGSTSGQQVSVAWNWTSLMVPPQTFWSSRESLYSQRSQTVWTTSEPGLSSVSVWLTSSVQVTGLSSAGPVVLRWPAPSCVTWFHLQKEVRNCSEGRSRFLKIIPLILSESS